MKKNKLAFSLVELAVVVLIIGIIAAGIMKGSSIIRSSRITSARSLTMSSHINEISGMVAWYETTMIDSLDPSQISDASHISEWHDISPESIAEQKNMLTRAASTDVTYVADGINNLPSIAFNASGNISMTSFYQGVVAQATCFIVFRPFSFEDNSTSTLIDSHSSATADTLFGIRSSSIRFNLGNAVSIASSFSVNNNYIITAYYDANNSRAFVNNATSMEVGTVSAGSNPLTGLTVGTKKTGTNSYNGLISEIIIYDHPLSIEERKSVTSYLSKKYKIAVAEL